MTLKVMKAPIVMLVLFWSLVLSPAAISQDSPPESGKVTLKLTTGETLTGKVGKVQDGSVSLITDYGPVRVPVEKLAPETKSQLGISGTVDVESLRVRIRELEDLVSRLREENANLRQAAPSRPATIVQPNTGVGVRPSTPPPDGVKYRLSSTGKRHNSRCRYFSSKGQDCGPSDGVACKICGG